MPCSSTRCPGRPPYVLFPLTAGLPLMGSRSCCANSPSGLREIPPLSTPPPPLLWRSVTISVTKILLGVTIFSELGIFHYGPLFPSGGHSLCANSVGFGIFPRGFELLVRCAKILFP